MSRGCWDVVVYEDDDVLVLEFLNWYACSQLRHAALQPSDQGNKEKEDISQ